MKISENNKNRKSKKVNKTNLAKNLGVCRQSLYYKPKLPAKDLELKKKIEEVLVEHKSYGHKRIAIHLGINRKRVLRVMKLFNLSPTRKPRVPVKIEDLKQEKSKNLNLFKEFNLNSPSQIWASDFTYLPYFNNKFLYLATIIDCFTKEITGWSLSSKHNSELIENALNDALSKRKKPKILHSDQGSEYNKSEDFTKVLKSNKIKQSMSKKGSPWQNGMQESFYGKFKLELGHPKCYETLGELVEAIAHQIYYYNNKRIHTAIKCPPVVFYQKCQMDNMRKTLKVGV
jgi:transposase InsO family protein